MKKLASILDKIASELEEKGLNRLALELDKVSNALEVSADGGPAGAPKMLVIMRGIPGSGKSTLAKTLVGGGKLFSTDEYEGLYDNSTTPPTFNGKLIPEAHAWNQKRAEEAMAMGVTPVIIDNTNTQKWEARPYVEAAHKHGYDITIQQPDGMFDLIASSPEKKEEILQKFELRNVHGVPLATLKRMLEAWEDSSTFNKDDILKSKAPWEQ